MHQKIFNEDLPILSAAQCRPMIVVSENIRYAEMVFCSVGPCEYTGQI